MRKNVLLVLLTLILLSGCGNTLRTYQLDGKGSSYVIYQTDDYAFKEAVYERKDGILLKKIDGETCFLSNGAMVTKVNEYNDCYLSCTYATTDDSIIVKDIDDNEFTIVRLDKENTSLDKHVFLIYGYLKHFDEDYSISINGEQAERISFGID